jgi:molybdopterin-binding protein
MTAGGVYTITVAKAISAAEDHFKRIWDAHSDRQLRNSRELAEQRFSRHCAVAGLCFSMTLSARNRLAGEIVELEFGGVMAHVVVRVGQDLIESVITKRSAEEMKLKIGDKVSAVIKSTEVMLEKN